LLGPIRNFISHTFGNRSFTVGCLLIYDKLGAAGPKTLGYKIDQVEEPGSLLPNPLMAITHIPQPWTDSLSRSLSVLALAQNTNRGINSAKSKR
jgi:hypothetical protein